MSQVNGEGIPCNAGQVLRLAADDLHKGLAVTPFLITLHIPVLTNHHNFSFHTNKNNW
jgi:hypothetical protein